MIEVKGVNKSFGENHVLKDINTEFKKGVVNMIIGQSGQGKSSTVTLSNANCAPSIPL